MMPHFKKPLIGAHTADLVGLPAELTLDDITNGVVRMAALDNPRDAAPVYDIAKT